jgi:hypothetical protein
MKKLLPIIFVFIFTAPLLFAQEQEVTVTFKQERWAGDHVFVGVGTLPGIAWDPIAAKIPDSNLALRLLTAKDGQSRLEWRETSGERARLELHNAKAPVDSQGNISMDTGFTLVVLKKSSVSLGDLKTRLSLSPGYYAVRVTIGQVEKSDWITIRIK